MNQDNCHVCQNLLTSNEKIWLEARNEFICRCQKCFQNHQRHLYKNDIIDLEYSLAGTFHLPDLPPNTYI